VGKTKAVICHSLPALLCPTDQGSLLLHQPLHYLCNYQTWQQNTTWLQQSQNNESYTPVATSLQSADHGLSTGQFSLLPKAGRNMSTRRYSLAFLLLVGG